jgi:meiotically up-regulated gene 157 (Mug157) protein
MVCLDVEFLKLEFNYYLMHEFWDLTFWKKLNKIWFVWKNWIKYNLFLKKAKAKAKSKSYLFF